MQYKNILKITSLLLFASASYARYTEECSQIEYALTRNLKKNLRDGESVEDFKPLKECVVGSDGYATEVYLVSERNNQSTIESVLGSQSLTKVTYLINNDFYQRDPAVFNDYPENIKNLENLEELNLKYYLKSFDHGEYPLLSGNIKKGALALTSKKIKTLTFDHINISKDNIKEISKLTSLETLVIEGGEIADVEALKKLNLKSLIINGEEYMTSTSSSSEYTEECKQIEYALTRDLKKNLRDGESVEDFKPLKECTVGSDGRVTEVYLVSERNNQSTIESVFGSQSLTKVTYFINNDFYQRDPAVFNDYPRNIKKLENLEELNLKYYLKSFDHGEYPLLSGNIKKGILALTSKKIKTLTFDHINISKDNIKEISKLKSLRTLIIEGGEIADVKALKKLNLKSLIINGKEYMTSTSSSSEYTEECKQIEYALTRDLKKNLRDGESVEDFKPLKECTVGSDGRVTEVYLVSERNNQSTIESVFGSQSLTKVTYFINNDFYQRDPAVFNDYPRNIKKLENLEELNLKYYLKSFDHGEYPLLSGNIKKGILALTSKKIKTLTFDHINISKDNIKEISKLKSLRTLIIEEGEVADVKALRNLKNLKTLIINGRILKNAN